jgi:hypothetical protein
MHCLAGLWLVCALPAWAEFSIQIGNPVAAQVAQVKSSSFVFRTLGCADPDKPEVSGTAEGLVAGARKTVRLNRIGTTAPGVYVVYREWGGDGTWVVNITGRCASHTASALVVVGGNGVDRAASKFYPRPATEAEITAVLKARETAK